MKKTLLLFSAVSFVLLTFDVFAAMSDCKNQIEVPVGFPGTTTLRMKFCHIPAGKAAIGSPLTAKSEPVFERTFESFEMSQFTVTQEQYIAVMEETPWKKADGTTKFYVREGNHFPAVYISHQKASEFAQKMNLIDTKAHYRLPTEAEYEYAARAGTTTEYYWGDEMNPDYAFYSGNVMQDYDAPYEEMYAREVTLCPNLSLIAGYCANGFGLMHMSGNVWQWTLDHYSPNYENASTNGHIPYLGGSTYVVRGGGWSSPEFSVRSATRSEHQKEYDEDDLVIRGIRLVRIPKSK